jgi:hypothetical protein
VTTVLVKTTYNYADEFDVYGLIVMDESIYLKGRTAVQLHFDNDGDEIEIYFGTNEAINIESFEDFESGIEIEYLTDDEVDMLERLLDSQFGNPILVWEHV